MFSKSICPKYVLQPVARVSNHSWRAVGIIRGTYRSSYWFFKYRLSVSALPGELLSLQAELVYMLFSANS